MGNGLRLVIFDVDGTLVDSQADILGAMTAAFQAVNRTAPDRETILGIVGLSLDVAVQRLAPDAPVHTQRALVDGYKDAYVALRAQTGAAQSSPLYPGAREVLEHLQQSPDVLLGVATGKSRRGLDKLIEAHGLERVFTTQQVADHHPSKPHPSMIEQAIAETGVTTDEAVMVGDTTFDMQMARAAGVTGIGVSWGYHPAAQLTDAHAILEQFADLPSTLNQIWGEPHE